jgi:mRNA interferase RelE/StbE
MSEPKPYKVEITTEAKDFLRDLDKSTRGRISKRINDLATDPRPSGHKKLKGQAEDIYRIRAGNYRVLYVIRDDVLKVIVIKVDHRKDVYRP